MYRVSHFNRSLNYTLFEKVTQVKLAFQGGRLTIIAKFVGVLKMFSRSPGNLYFLKWNYIFFIRRLIQFFNSRQKAMKVLVSVYFLQTYLARFILYYVVRQ